MEQLYLVEIMIDKVSIYIDEKNETRISSDKKNLVIKVTFGPKMEFVFREDGRVRKSEDVVCPDAMGNRKFTRVLRQGKSILFPSYPDLMLEVLKNFPLSIVVFNDDINEGYKIYVGEGIMDWDTEFYEFFKCTAIVTELHEPLAVKTMAYVKPDTSGLPCGEVHFICRISALGDMVVTEFLELAKNSEKFLFATNKAATRFCCHRQEGIDTNFTMVGTVYESVTLEDPDVMKGATNRIEVCTELQNCGLSQPDAKCTFPADVPKKYSLQNIRMGDIRGPCGNPNCELAHKVKEYIRNLDTYKKTSKEQTKLSLEPNKAYKAHACGSCICEDEKWHRDSCPEKSNKKDGLCKLCGAPMVKDTCEESDNLNQTSARPSPNSSKTTPPSPCLSEPSSKCNKTVNYMMNETRDPELMESLFGKDFTTRNLTTNYDFEHSYSHETQNPIDSELMKIKFENDLVVQNVSIKYDLEDLCNHLKEQDLQEEKQFIENSVNKESTSRGLNQDALIYNANTSQNTTGAHQVAQFYNCLISPDDKDCKCAPIRPTPPCKSADCECIQKIISERSRKIHKPFCPSYRHKTGCPVTIGENEEAKNEFEEEEPESLPYGLPPIKLGPCPVMGRPCSVPDGFARMYKVAAMPPQPASYNDAGKVCCSKEFERIKNCLKEYMNLEKEPDYRCINQFNVDTEKRCCDKDDFRMALTGKDCCGSHKMAIQEKYKYDK